MKKPALAARLSMAYSRPCAAHMTTTPGSLGNTVADARSVYERLSRHPLAHIRLGDDRERVRTGGERHFPFGLGLGRGPADQDVAFFAPPRLATIPPVNKGRYWLDKGRYRLITGPSSVSLRGIGAIGKRRFLPNFSGKGMPLSSRSQSALIRREPPICNHFFGFVRLYLSNVISTGTCRQFSATTPTFTFPPTPRPLAHRPSTPCRPDSIRRSLSSPRVSGARRPTRRASRALAL